MTHRHSSSVRFPEHDNERPRHPCFAVFVDLTLPRSHKLHVRCHMLKSCKQEFAILSPSGYNSPQTQLRTHTPLFLQKDGIFFRRRGPTKHQPGGGPTINLYTAQTQTIPTDPKIRCTYSAGYTLQGKQCTRGRPLQPLFGSHLDSRLEGREHHGVGHATRKPSGA